MNMMQILKAARQLMKRLMLTLAAVAVVFGGLPAAQAAITQADSTGDASGFSVSASDLVNQGQATLSSATRSHVPEHSTSGDFGGYDPANTGLNVPYANDGAIGAFSTSPWGKNVEYYPMTNPTSAYALPVTYTFALNTSINTAGYDITNITSTCGYLWNNDWTANQVFQVEITKDGSTWLSLGTYTYAPYTTTTQNAKVTQVSLASGGAALDNGTYVAQHVTGIRITYSDTGNRGGFDGTAIKEIDVLGQPSAPLVVSAAASTVTASPASVVNDGVTTSTITVTLKAADSTPVAGRTVTLASSRGATDTISAASGASDASGVVTFTVSSSTAGSPVFTATDTTDSVTVTQTATVTFTAGAVSAAHSTVVASPTSVTADGSTTSTITVTLKDAGNSPVAGKTVTLASSRGATDTISAASGASDASGVVTFTVTSTTPGSPVFTATDTTDVLTITQTATVTFTVGAVSAAQSTVGASPALVTANGSSNSTITVTLKDAFGNRVAGKTVLLASSRGATDAISAASGVSSASGVVTFTVTSLTAGSPVFTATGDSVTITQTATVTFGASAADSTVGASPASVTADGVTTSTITVTLKDGAANPVAGKTVTLTSSRGGTDTISAASGVSSGSGVVTFTVKSTTAGSPVFTARDTTDSLTVTQTATVTFTAGAVSATQSTVGALPSSLAPNGSTPSTITVTLKDAFGNPVAGKTVSLVSSRGATDTISAASGASDASGVVTFTVTSSTAGSPVFTATGDSVTITQTATVTFTLYIIQSNLSTNTSSAGKAAGGFTATATDLVNQGQPTLSSATRSHVPVFGDPGNANYDVSNAGPSPVYANDGQIGDFITSPWGKNVELFCNTTTSGWVTANTLLPVTYTFTLDTSINIDGYDITNITSTCGFLWNRAWLANQKFQVEITRDGSTWLDMGTYSYIPVTSTSGSDTFETQVVLSNGGGVLNTGIHVAQNVRAIRITYLSTNLPSPNSDLDGTAIKEIDVLGMPSAKILRGTIIMVW